MNAITGALELLRQLHGAERLAIALWLGVPEVAVDLLLRIAAATFVMSDDHHRVVFVTRESSDDCVIVGESAVAAYFSELRKQSVDVIEQRRAVVVPRHHDPLPRRQAGVDIGPKLIEPTLQAIQCLLPLPRPRLRRQRVDLLQEWGEWFLKLQQVGRHTPLRAYPSVSILGPLKLSVMGMTEQVTGD